MDVVLQVVLLPLEHGRLPPQPVGTGPLVLEGGGLDCHHRDGARLHSCLLLSGPGGREDTEQGQKNKLKKLSDAKLKGVRLLSEVNRAEPPSRQREDKPKKGKFSPRRAASLRTV